MIYYDSDSQSSITPGPDDGPAHRELVLETPMGLARHLPGLRQSALAGLAVKDPETVGEP